MDVIHLLCQVPDYSIANNWSYEAHLSECSLVHFLTFTVQVKQCVYSEIYIFPGVQALIVMDVLHKIL
jgi:hypothetical protein